METIAGTLLGMDKHTICLVGNGDAPVSIRIRGRWLYTRKCRRAEEYDGIFLTDNVRDDTVFHLLLALGEDCGKDERRLLRWNPGILSKRKKWIDWLPQVELGPVEPGRDRIMVPDDHPWGIMRSPYNKDEYFISECLAMAVVD